MDRAEESDEQRDNEPKKQAGIVSKTLGYCIIVGAAGAKAPQILQIMRAGNAAGLSLLMPVMEVLGYTATYSYHAAKGHPLSSYGEDYFNCFQAAVVSYQILAYQGRLASRTVQLLGLVLYGTVVGVLISLRKLIGTKRADRILGALMSAATGVFITARWPQIILNFRNWGVGQLNIATTLLYFFGNCIRLYTTATQLGYDKLTMISSSCSALGNFTLAAQWFILGKGVTS